MGEQIVPSFSPIAYKTCKFCKRCNGCDKDDCPERCIFYPHVQRSEPFCRKCEGHIVDGVIVCYDCSKTVIEKPGLCHDCMKECELEMAMQNLVKAMQKQEMANQNLKMLELVKLKLMSHQKPF